MLLSAENLVKSFGGLTATNHCSLTVDHLETHSIIGPNGAGKSTLVKQLTGELKPDSGRIFFDGTDLTGLAPYRWAHFGIGRSYQITSVFQEFSIIENAVLAALAQQGSSFGIYRPVSAEQKLTAMARQALAAVDLSDDCERIVKNISHGEQRQLELAMALVNHPKLLVLDEPLAGMGRQESEKIKSLLLRLKSSYSILLIEHDMDAVFKLSDRITCLAYGKVVCCGTPDEVRNAPEVRVAYLGESPDEPILETLAPQVSNDR
ncbi:MAG: ABC transporter ATP-binding protein [Janthinobacterium lividum]